MHVKESEGGGGVHVPHAFEMHRSNLDNMAHFLALENSITTASSHTCHVQEFGTVDHMIV